MGRYRMMPTYRFYDVEGNSPLALDKSVGKPLRDYKIYGSCGERTNNLFNHEPLRAHTGYHHPDILTQIDGGIQLKTLTCATTLYPEDFLAMTGLNPGDKVIYGCDWDVLNGSWSSTTSEIYRGSLYFKHRTSSKDDVRFFNINQASNPAGMSPKEIPENFNKDNYEVLRIYGAYNTADGSAPIVNLTNMFLRKADVDSSYEPYGYKIPIKVTAGDSFEETTNIYLDAPLAEGDFVDFKSQKVVRGNVETLIDVPQIKTHKGTNIISVNTELTPSNIKVQYYK